MMVKLIYTTATWNDFPRYSADQRFLDSKMGQCYGRRQGREYSPACECQKLIISTTSDKQAHWPKTSGLRQC